MEEDICKYIYDETAISKIHKQLIQTNNKKQTWLKWTKNSLAVQWLEFGAFTAVA